MAKRRIVRKQKSKKIFKKGMSTHKKNMYTKPTRGGHRL
jgi:hypothetical protein